jgi:hypothetical protein
MLKQPNKHIFKGDINQHSSFAEKFPNPDLQMSHISLYDLYS